MDLVNGVVVQEWWLRYGYGILPFHESYMSHELCLIGVDRPQTTAWPQTTPMTYSAVTLDIVTKIVNHGHCQWCSGASMMTRVWIWYPTILWVLCKAWTTSDRRGSPHIPPHDHRLHPRFTQLLPWIFKPRVSWTIDLINGIVVQGWWRKYWYGIPPFMSIIWVMK